MPAYNPNDYVWQEIYIMFDQIGQAIQAALLYVQGISTTLVVAGIGCLAFLIVLWAWEHGSVAVRRPVLSMVPHTQLIVLPAVLLFFLIVTPASAQSSGRAWFMRSGAEGDGTSAASPIGSTMTLESISGPGDIILLYPGETPLDGGLALKPGQALIGISEAGRKPVITNADSTRHEGNGIVLAEESRIWNVRIEDTYASGIYGVDVAGVSIDEVEVVGANQSRSFMTASISVLGPAPHGGIVFIQSSSKASRVNRIVWSEVIDAAGIGIASLAFGDAKSRLVVTDSRVEGGTPVARFDMGIAILAEGPSSDMHLALTGTTVRGRMSRGGRNVVVLANADGTATARIERSHSGAVGQDGILGVTLQNPATVAIEIRDTIVEQAGQTNVEGTMANVPPFDASRVDETLVTIDIENSVVRNIVKPDGPELDDLGLGNIWIGSSALAQQMMPDSDAPFQPGRIRLTVLESEVIGSGDFGIGVGNKGANWGIGPETGAFEIKLRDNTIRVEGAADIQIAAPGAAVDARRNCWGVPEGIAADRIRLLETATRAQLDASEPVPCAAYEPGLPRAK